MAILVTAIFVRKISAWRTSRLLLSLAACGLFFAAGCNSGSKPISAENSQFQVAEGNGGDKTSETPDAAPAVPATPKPLTPPKKTKTGTETTEQAPTDPVERTAFLLTQIERMRPQGTTPQEIQESFLQILNQRVQVAQELLNTSKKDEQRIRAVEAITETLMTMQQMGIPEAGNSLAQFAEAISADKSEAISLRGKQMVLQFAVEDLIDDKGKSLPQFLEQIDGLLAIAKNEENFDLLQKVCMVLNQSSMNKESNEVLNKLVTAYEKHENPEIIEAIGIVREMQGMSEAGLSGAMSAFLKKEEGAGPALFDVLKKVLAGPFVGKGTLSQLRQVVTMLEGEDVALAAAVGKEVSAVYGQHKDEKVVTEANAFLENSQKRLALIGKEFTVQGKTVEGEAFDWAPYQGKVVLIDFWATWCQPCLAEIPNIVQNYDNYKEKGFEVVGVNLDDDPNSVVKFLTVQPLKWTTVISADEANVGFKNPLATACGVEMIPFVMLIGRDGKVDSIHVRGKRLNDRLAKLLGDAPAANPTGNSQRLELKPEGKTNDDIPVNSLRQKTTVRKPVSEDPAEESQPAGCVVDEAPAATAETADAADAKPALADEKPANPYLAKPSLSKEQLIDYLLRMEDKPKVIRLREGFAEALIDACDRILAANPSETQTLLALETKGQTLHQWAGRGTPVAEEAWRKFTADLRADSRPRIARMIALFVTEQKIADAATENAENIPSLLKATKEYLSQEKLDNRHLRLASNTVALINRLDNGDERETHFKEFGTLFAKSKDKELARYGKKLAQDPGSDESDLIGKPIELVGSTLKGEAFDIQTLRGKVVVVDFWATWCGPCRKELPRLEAVFEKLHPQGLEVVGVSLDADLDALTAFLEEHPLPWTTLAGEGNQAIAEKYGVRGIPTLMVIDRTGKIAGVAHSIEQLKGQVEKLLAAK